MDHTIRIWNPGDGTQIRVLNGHTDTVWELIVNELGKPAERKSKCESYK